MKKRKIEEALHRAVTALPLPSAKEVLSTPVVKMTEHDYITTQNPARGPAAWNLTRTLAAGACCCALVLTFFSVWFVQYRMVDSTVMLDVNPSIEITINRRDQVLDTRGINQDAQQLLADKKYRGQDVSAVVEDMMTTLVENQYLDQSRNTILLSVKNKKSTRIKVLEDSLSVTIQSALETEKINPKIIVQMLNTDRIEEEKAQQYHISPSKLQFIAGILKEKDDYTLDELATMSMEQLLRLSKGEDLDTDDDDDTDTDDEESEEVEDSDEIGDHDDDNEAKDVLVKKQEKKEESDDSDSEKKIEHDDDDETENEEKSGSSGETGNSDDSDDDSNEES